MNFQKGYELQRLVSKLRIRGMYSDADKLEENRSTNGLSNEAVQIIKEEARKASFSLHQVFRIYHNLTPYAH